MRRLARAALTTVPVVLASLFVAPAGASQNPPTRHEAAAASQLSAAGDPAGPPTGASPTGLGDPYQEHNGYFTIYVRDPEGFDGYEYPATTYSSITDKIKAGWFSDRGIHHIGIYGAWKASHHWLGIPPLDFFDAQVGTGTIADFTAMSKAARARGITVYIYMELIYIHPDNPVFQKAARDEAAGVDSFESRLFRWDERPQPQASCPSDEGLPGAASWTRDPSVADNRCYVQSWGEAGGELPRGFPSFDYERPEAMRYAKKVLKFWMDRGVTGFIYDAPHTYLGMQGANEWRQSELQIRYVANYLHPGDDSTHGLYLDAEGDIGRYQEQARADRIGFSAVHVGAEDDFNTFVTMAARNPQLLTSDDLEDHFATWVDVRRQNGRWGLAHSPFDTDPTTMPAALRALDAAVQAGAAGVAVFNHEPPLNSLLDDQTRETFYDVFRAIDRSTALAPGASRERVPTQADPRAYAVLRRSMDRRETAVAVFNLGPDARCVSVNLAGTGVVAGQRTTDVASGNPGPRLKGQQLSVSLSAYGYRFLSVKAGAGFPWRTIDSADGWRTGGGWQDLADPSAVGGSRIGGDRAGGYARITFQGRTVQGWGRMATDGGTRILVTIDGKSYGVHSQRRDSPVPAYGGDGFYGQQLFSIAGLAQGRHTLELRQLYAGSGRGGETGVDYLRVSDRVYQPQRTPSSSDCG